MRGLPTLTRSSFCRTLLVAGYWPVAKAAREGLQSGYWLYRFVKRTPLSANLSRLGVRMSLLPAEPIASHRC